MIVRKSVTSSDSKSCARSIHVARGRLWEERILIELERVEIVSGIRRSLVGKLKRIIEVLWGLRAAIRRSRRIKELWRISAGRNIKERLFGKRNLLQGLTLREFDVFRGVGRDSGRRSQ